MTLRTDEPAEERLRLAARLVDEGKFPEAIALLKPLADLHDPRAQLLLGWLIQNGRGVSKDTELAERLYRAGAEQRDPMAMFYLAQLSKAHGSTDEAIRWYEQASSRGFAPATFRLALHHLARGNEREGIVLLRAASVDGHLPSVLRLARLSARRGEKLANRAKALFVIPWTLARIVLAGIKNENDVRILY